VNIGPIHEIDWGEINHALGATWDGIEALYTHPNIKPKKTRSVIERQIEFNLNTRAQSIRQSLAYFYPEKERNLSEVIDANEAWWFRQGLKESHIIPTPLYKGIEALLQIFLMLEGYQSDYRPEDRDYILSEFRELERVLKEYVPIAKKYYLEKRAKDWSAKGGKAPKKQPEFDFLVKYAWDHSKRKTCLGMWNFLKRKLQDAEVKGEKINGFDFVYEKKLNKITLYFLDGKSRDIGFRSFQRYVKDFKEGLKKNSQ
jgi:hypothetical protein